MQQQPTKPLKGLYRKGSVDPLRYWIIDGVIKRRPEYKAWMSMRDRCYRNTDPYYKDYGGRGITVTTEWLTDYEAFLAHVGCRPSARHSIDRIDVNGNYEPGNVRWATMKEQSRNRRNNVNLTYQGATRSVSEWAEHVNIKATTIFQRIAAGWPVEKTLSHPVRPCGR